MKKSIIAASAASLALAAMPVVGVFATVTPDGGIVDNLTVNLTKTCTVTRTGTVAGMTATDPSWSNATGTDAGTYTGSLTAGEVKTLGKSTFTVSCNDQNKGHSMSVAVCGLDSTDNGSQDDKTIPYSNSEVTAAVSGWNITTTANANLGTTAGIISTTSGTGSVYGNKKLAVTAQSFDATYTVSADVTQPSGTYTGSATYTLTYDA